MKEETKDRLKKFGKVAVYGFGLFAMLFLGVGLGNCSANGKRAQSQPVPASSLADHKTLSPKRALDSAEYPTLGTYAGNLLRGAEGGHFRYDYVHDDDLWGIRPASADAFDTYLLRLSAGNYFLDFSCDDSTSWKGGFYLMNQYGASQVRKALNGEPLARCFVEWSDIDQSTGAYDTFTDGDPLVRYAINVTASYDYILIHASHGHEVSLFLADYANIPAVATFDFPVLFNPYPLGGSPASGDFIFNGPSVSGVTSQTLYINGLTFRSNGKLYNKVMLTYTHDSDQPFGHYDASGNFVNDGMLGANAWYFRSMTYLFGTQYGDVVWNAKYENVDSNLAWKPSLVSGGLWVSQDYRQIEVISFTGAHFTDLPSTSLVANSSVESVLKLISTYFAPSTSEMGNPFTLIREGFSAVGGIMQIQILPFMTLGTLIFVPLVVLVILAILKLLAK